VCQDLNDGDISSHVQVLAANVDLSVPGTYHVKYECTNSHGVAATPKSRTIVVLAAAASGTKPILCPTPRCAAPMPGCQYDANSELHANGCAKYPCGKLNCSELQCPAASATEACNVQPCPEDCVVSQWGDWASCSQSCGSGTQQRTRTGTMYQDLGSNAVRPPVGKPCPSLFESQECNPQHCPVDCVVSRWTLWGACDASCGTGRQERHRSIDVDVAFGGRKCWALNESRDCMTQECPVDCVPSTWGSWSSCSKTCGAGTQTRERSISVDAQFGGKACPALESSQFCRTTRCPIDCVVSPWSEFGACSRTCGTGAKTRTRTAVTAAGYGGQSCPPLLESQACATECCEGHFGPAGSCAPCEPGTFQAASNAASCAACSSGTYSSTHGAKACKACPKGHFGDDMKGMQHAGHCVQCPAGQFQLKDGSDQCVDCEADTYINESGSPHCKPCPAGQSTAGLAGQTVCSDTPVTCSTSAWTPWTTCSSTCGTGTQHRARTITRYPEHGPFCPKLQETQLCNTQPCPVDCKLGTFNEWSLCTKSCGTGSRSRSRTVIADASAGGKACAASVQEESCNTAPCAVNCQFNEWSGWGVCSQPCGTGYQTRSRSIRRDANHGGLACGKTTATRTCNRLVCAVDCVESPFGAWSACTSTCNGGTQIRYRSVDRDSNFGGKACGVLQETRVCNTQPCAVNCATGSWNAWSECSMTCGDGQRTRTRVVKISAQHGGVACGALSETGPCNDGLCPVHCMTSDWTAWSLCSASCGTGTQHRARVVQQVPTVGGHVCPALRQSQSCNEQPCPVDCAVTAYAAWNACTVSCGEGTKTRHRTITTKTQNGGKSCPVLSETKTCNTQTCPVDCVLSDFGDWGACSKSCGAGIQSRTRADNVQAAHGGRPCPTPSETQTCNTHNCPRPCLLSSWGDWGYCSKTCGGGLQARFRSINQAAGAGGAPCGQLTASRSCAEQDCPVDCKMSTFGAWSDCSLSCGGGSQSRSRSASVNQAYGGITCPAATEMRTCNSQDCPVSCELSTWSQWSECSVGCGDGTHTKTRTIIRDVSNGGSACGILTHTAACDAGPCPVNCVVSAWTAFGPCSKTCGSGTRVRTRSITQKNLHNGATVCPSLSELQVCSSEPCALDCQVTTYGAWSTCTASCGSGSQTRARTVTRVASHGGAACPPLQATRSCNTFDCPMNCVQGNWGEWGDCSVSCGSGHKTRSRSVIDHPTFGGKYCDAARISTTCNAHPCPTDCVLSAFTSWTQCSASCGRQAAAHSRRRVGGYLRRPGVWRARGGTELQRHSVPCRLRSSMAHVERLFRLLRPWHPYALVLRPCRNGWRCPVRSKQTHRSDRGMQRWPMPGRVRCRQLG
jgi:hypothetical protein